MAISNGDENDPDYMYRMPVNMRTVELHHCGPGRAGHPKTGDPIAIVTFVCNRRLDQSMMLQLNEVRRLVAKLIAVLDHHNDPLGKTLKETYFDDYEWPTDTTHEVSSAKKDARRRRAKPSVRKSTPKTSVSEIEVWQMIQMLRKVQDHETFMRLIGVRAADMPKKPSVKASKILKNTRKPKQK